MMEEWQRRQRAEKEKDRQQKQASAELLSGYRAAELDAEALKLKELREQERLQRQEAETTLHNFKKLEEPLHKGKNSTTNDKASRTLPVPVNAGGSQHNEDDDIAFGSVSALKANFNDSFTPSHNSVSSANTGAMMMNEVSPIEAPLVSDAISPLPPSGETTGIEAAMILPHNQVADETITNNSILLQPSLTSTPPLTTTSTEPAATTTTTHHSTLLKTTAATADISPSLTPPVIFTFGIITNGNNTSSGQTVGPAYEQGLAKILQVPTSAIQIRSVTRDMSYPSPTIRYVVMVEVVEMVGTDTAAASMVYEAVRSAIQNGRLYEASCSYETM